MRTEAEQLDWILGFAERWGTDEVPIALTEEQALALLEGFDADNYQRALDLCRDAAEEYYSGLEMDCGV